MNYDILKTQVINKININSFNKLVKNCNDGNLMPEGNNKTILHKM